jgi:hypothetical protein
MWLDHKDQLDHKVMLVILVQQAQVDQVVPVVVQAHQDQVVYQAMWLDHKVRLDHKAMLVILVRQAQADHQVHLDQVEQAVVVVLVYL